MITTVDVKLTKFLGASKFLAFNGFIEEDLGEPTVNYLLKENDWCFDFKFGI